MDRFDTYQLELKLTNMIDQLFSDDVQVKKENSIYSIYNNEISISFEIFENT